MRLALAAAVILMKAAGAEARPRPNTWGTQDRSTLLTSLLDKPVDRPWEVTVAANGRIKTFTLDDLSAIRVRFVIPF